MTETQTQTMTKGEWVEASFNMAWCIYNTEDITAYRNGFKTDQDPLLTWQQLRLDFSAPASMPDGVHKVLHESKLGHRPRRRRSGQRRPVCARAHTTCGLRSRLQVLPTGPGNRQPKRPPPAGPLLNRRLPMGRPAPRAGSLDRLLKKPPQLSPKLRHRHTPQTQKLGRASRQYTRFYSP